MQSDLHIYDAIGSADLIRKGELRATELLEDTIERIEKLNPKLNAVIYKAYDQARQIAEGCDAGSGQWASPDAPFYGVPFLLKDLVAEARGLPLHEGSRFVEGYVSKIDSELVARQKSAGLIIAGKTNTPEFGLVPTTEPELSGPTLNPWNTALTPGGSSGGSAAAVAAGIVPMAHANDGGGSIRIPASCCGLFGLKPTRGRNPLGPLFGDMGSGLCCEHAVTRTVRDSAALLDATSGPAPGDPYWAPPKARPFLEETRTPPGKLKIGLLDTLPDGWTGSTEVHPDCKAAVDAAARLCEHLGHVVEAIDPAEISWPHLARSFGHLFACFAAHACLYWENELGKKAGPGQLESLSWISVQAGLKLSAGAYLATIQDIQRFSRMLARFHESNGYDVILSPTMACPPTEIGAFAPTPDEPMRGYKASAAFIAFTKVQNITGDPAMSVPLFWNEAGVPIGVQFAGRFGDEATLLRLAAQLEKEQPWADKTPAIHCGAVFKSF
jgi:amidase